MRTISKKELEKIELFRSQIERAEEERSICGFSERCRENEEFYLGMQWRSGEDDTLIKPVFNVIRQISNYLISSLVSNEYAISYSLDGAPPYRRTSSAKAALDALSRHISFCADKETKAALLSSLVHDAILYGSGVLYTYWDASADNGDGYMGAFRTETLHPTALFPALPECEDVQKQPYIIIKGRQTVGELVRELLSHGGEASRAVELMEKYGEDGEHTSVNTYLRLQKDPIAKKIDFIKLCGEVIVSEGRMDMERYPIAVYSPSPKSHSFFGYSYVESMVPNQRYINRAYALLMKHMQDTAFSKVIYDASRIPDWSSTPGESIAAHGGGNLSDCVSVVGCGELSDGYMDLIERTIEQTRYLFGANDTALGNAEPQNTSAILAMKESASGQLREAHIRLAKTIEEQAYIWAEMVCANVCEGRYVSFGEGKGEDKVDFSTLKRSLLRCRVDVSDKSRFGSSVSLSVLNLLLEQGVISPKEYVARLPEGIIPDKDALLLTLSSTAEADKMTVQAKGR